MTGFERLILYAMFGKFIADFFSKPPEFYLNNLRGWWRLFRRQKGKPYIDPDDFQIGFEDVERKP